MDKQARYTYIRRWISTRGGILPKGPDIDSIAKSCGCSNTTVRKDLRRVGDEALGTDSEARKRNLLASLYHIVHRQQTRRPSHAVNAAKLIAEIEGWTGRGPQVAIAANEIRVIALPEDSNL